MSKMDKMNKMIKINTIKNPDLDLIVNNLFSMSFMTEKIKQYTFHPGGVHYLVL
jgi:hypothetical protein